MSDPRFQQQGFDKLLAHLVEECGEVLAAAGKTQRWGPFSVNPLLPPNEQETNLAWLRREMADLAEALDRLDTQIRKEYEAVIARASLPGPSAEESGVAFNAGGAVSADRPVITALDRETEEAIGPLVGEIVMGRATREDLCMLLARHRIAAAPAQHEVSHAIRSLRTAREAMMDGRITRYGQLLVAEGAMLAAEELFALLLGDDAGASA